MCGPRIREGDTRGVVYVAGCGGGRPRLSGDTEGIRLENWGRTIAERLEIQRLAKYLQAINVIGTHFCINKIHKKLL